MSSLPTKEAILDSFSQFFQKLVSQHPLKDELLQNLTNFQQLILSDNSNYLQTKTFISSLYQRSLTKPTQPTLNSSGASSSTSSSLPTDTTLKGFSPEKLRYPFSLLTKFTYASFQDYLTKNSISPAVESSLMHKYSHIREFLPDSQNFYRALGLGLLETYLGDASFIHHINDWYGKVFRRQVILSTQIYPFSPEELRSTFCGYLKQLLQVREDSDETKEGRKSRNLLYQMDSKDTVFDISLISFIKELLISRLGIERELSSSGIENRIKANDSTVIGDLLMEIPRCFDVSIIVQVVQNKVVTEHAYNVPGKDPKACPTLHILNEKQLSYQNFCVLNLDSLETESQAEARQAASHSRNNSVPRIDSLNVISKPEKSFNSELKATSERIEKTARPPQGLGRRTNALNLYEDMRSVSDKPSKDDWHQPLKLMTDLDGIKSDGEREERIVTDREASPSNCIVSLNKLLKTHSSASQREQNTRNSPPKRMRGITSYKDLLSQTENPKPFTPPKAKKYHFGGALESPTNFKLQPLTLNPTPRGLPQERSLSHNTSLYTNNITSEAPSQIEDLPVEKKQKDIQMKNINILGGILKTRSENTTIPDSKAYSSNDPRLAMKSMADQSKADADPSKPKIITMVPKFMSTIPYNPFSMGGSTGSTGSRPPSGLQPQEYTLTAARNSDKVGSKFDYGFPSEAGKRFSLNPSSFLGQNADYLQKKYNSRDVENKIVNLSTQEESNNENSGIVLEKRQSYRPSANVSLGPYGLESTRMY